MAGDDLDFGQGQMGRDVFMALAAIGWADGTLDQDEGDAIIRTAAEQGLSIEDLEAIEAACKQRVDLETIDRSQLSKVDRLFVFGVACWMTRLDGSVDEAERRALATLGQKLSVPENLQARVEDLTKKIEALPDGDRPDRYDLSRLRSVLEDGLRRAAARREEA